MAKRVRRFYRRYLGKPESDLDPRLLERGAAALTRMEAWLEASPYLLSGADISLVASTRLSHEGGLDLAKFPAVKAWVGRVDADLGIEAPL